MRIWDLSLTQVHDDRTMYQLCHVAPCHAQQSRRRAFGMAESIMSRGDVDSTQEHDAEMIHRRSRSSMLNRDSGGGI